MRVVFKLLCDVTEGSTGKHVFCFIEEQSFQQSGAQDLEGKIQQISMLKFF
jgi:hypothetical protein